MTERPRPEVTASAGAHPPLRRNRDFTIFWTSQVALRSIRTVLQESRSATPGNLLAEIVEGLRARR